MFNWFSGATALIGVGVVLGAGLGIARAQEPPIESIVVTGSRIPVNRVSETQPVIELDQEAIQRTGLTSTVDILQRLPVAAGGLNAKFNNSGNFGNPPDGGGVGAGAAEIDLRYLGSRRVLVLVDGLRWVPGSSASGVPGGVDLNTIPYSMIERIEVLQEGASPIYGSDAIAGVVNIITKTKQQGMQFSVQGGQYSESDGDLTDINASWGASEGNTSLVVGLGYYNQEGVSSNDRDISRFPAPNATSCLAGGCSSGTLLGRMILHDPNTDTDLDITPNQPFPPGTTTGSCPSGDCPFYNPADPTGAGADFHAFDTPDRFNFQPYNFVVTPAERESLFAHIRHELTDHMYLKALGTYVNRKSENQAAPLPLFVGPAAGNGNLLDTVTIDATNPYNPFGFNLDSNALTFIGRRLIENGPRHYSQDVNTWNITTTLGGDFALGSRNWNWDLNGVWARNHADQLFTGNVNAASVVQALGPVALCTGACVPLNIFSGEGSVTPEMLHFIAFTQHDTSEQELNDYTANITGDLFDLPAGPLGIAVGWEHRDNSGFFEPDPIVAAGLSSDIPALPTSGSIHVNEYYGEVRVPVLADLPLVYKFDLNLSGRWFDYSTSGSDSTYKVGAQWRPVEELLLRGSWAQGFRAPSIGELFGSASRFDQEATDPCSDMLGLQPGGTVQPPNVQANCIDAGVPADGSYVQINPQLPVFVGGNSTLQPETSEAWTYGLKWQPSFMRDAGWSTGGSIEVVYSDIKLDGAIQGLDAVTLLDRCAQSGEPFACATITRTTGGQISRIDNLLTNIGGIETQAVDLNLEYSSPEWGWGQLTARWYSTFLLKFDEKQPTAEGFTTVSREGTERGSPDQAYPETKSSLMLDWQKAAWGATLGMRYIDAITEQTDAGPHELGSAYYLDAQVRWTPPVASDRFELAVGGTNLFDEEPPGCVSCGLNNFDPNAYDAPGRWYYLRLSYRE